MYLPKYLYFPFIQISVADPDPVESGFLGRPDPDPGKYRIRIRILYPQKKPVIKIFSF